MTEAQEASIRERLDAVEARLSEHFDRIADAEGSGYPASLTSRAWSRYDAISNDLDLLYADLVAARASGSDAASLEARTASLEARVAADPLGEGAIQARTSGIVFATLGSLAVAASAAGLIWLLTAKRRG